MNEYQNNRMTRAQRYRPRGGFTLIELLVVIVVIGILAGILLPAILKSKNQGKRRQVVSEMRAIKGAMLAYQLEKRNWPDAGIVDKMYTTHSAITGPLTNAMPPYLDAADFKISGGTILDPWGSAYEIRVDHDHDGYFYHDGYVDTNKFMPDGLEISNVTLHLSY